MRIEVDEMVSDVHALDDAALLSRPVLDRIVAQVLQAVREDEGHRERLASERAIAGGGTA